jgi:hypothetical protein
MDQIKHLESNRSNVSSGSERPRNTTGSVKLRKWPPGASDEEPPQPPKDNSPAGVFGVKLKTTGKLTPEPTPKSNIPKRGSGGKIMAFVRRTEAAAAAGGGSPQQPDDL